MKQLFINHKASTIFFKSEDSIEKIFKWVKSNVDDHEVDIFNLNEPHTCEVKIYGEEMIISGDEDSVSLIFETIIPIKLL